MEEKIIEIDGKEYKFGDLTDQQKYLVRQIDDLRAQRAQAQFRIDQVNVSEKAFTDILVQSFSEEVKEEAKQEG